MNLKALPLTLMGMLGLTTLTASAAGFYRFEQWSAPVWGNPALTPGNTYYWYQPLPGNPLGQTFYNPQGQTFYWYQYGQPQAPSSAFAPQSLQGPYYWYWFQPYY